MPQQFTNIHGRKVTLFSETERDFYVNNWGKSPKSFDESPQWVMDLLGLTLPVFVYHTSITQDGVFWENNFGVPKVVGWKPGFLDIYTNGMGELTGDEVRALERSFGPSFVDDHVAVNQYNNLLRQTHEQYHEDLSLDELKALLSVKDYARLIQVHQWVTSVIGAEPIYFSIDTPMVISEDVVNIEGIDFVTIQDAVEGETIGVAFPGPHCLKRDVFTRKIGVQPDDGVNAIHMPGRDRWFRITGVNTFSAFLYSPVITLSRIQISQLKEGRPVTMPQSPIVPPYLLSR